MRCRQRPLAAPGSIPRTALPCFTGSVNRPHERSGQGTARWTGRFDGPRLPWRPGKAIPIMTTRPGRATLRSHASAGLFSYLDSVSPSLLRREITKMPIAAARIAAAIPKVTPAFLLLGGIT